MKERMKLFLHTLSAAMMIIVVMTAMLFVAWAVIGCSRKTEIVHDVRTDSVFVERIDTFRQVVEVVRIDTLRTADSIILREVVTVKVSERGDTVWRDRVVYRDRWHNVQKVADHSAAVSTDSKTVDISTKKTNVAKKEEVAKYNSPVGTYIFCGLMSVSLLFLGWLVLHRK